MRGARRHSGFDDSLIQRLSGFCWQPLLCPQTWLGHTTPDEFLGVSVSDLLGFVPRSDLEDFLSTRGTATMDDAALQQSDLLRIDIACFSHALSALLSMSCDDAHRLMPVPIAEVLGNEGVAFDHIGIEIFGKLEWYSELFDRAYAPLGINMVREHIFPSVQVRKALEYDPHLGDVRIGRVYFEHGEVQVNLEVFEPAQNWRYIALRQALLFAHLEQPAARLDAVDALLQVVPSAPEPVGHVAYRVDSANTVHEIQRLLLEESSKGSAARMRPYSRQVFFNPSDGSTNTKFVVSTPLANGMAINSQIVEIVSYQ